ncbi:hypothetical protein FA95DRAFT_644711 [Auriscalpium vulgare]|uniref:Uncharacterized protein n=1 Tax=Auriscalpium vulgare TaxID=40419 RepID=A0ACB8S373_9AGAM|nr:hypothetical protein FA95DRAFT_644711 [Auriscalpium vulgare]
MYMHRTMTYEMLSVSSSPLMKCDDTVRRLLKPFGLKFNEAQDIRMSGRIGSPRITTCWRRRDGATEDYSVPPHSSQQNHAHNHAAQNAHTGKQGHVMIALEPQSLSFSQPLSTPTAPGEAQVCPEYYCTAVCHGRIQCVETTSVPEPDLNWEN